MPTVGAHVSASGGLYKTIDRATQIGAKSIQVFSGSPRVWTRQALDDVDFDKFFEAKKNSEIDQVVTHAMYLVNLASDKKELVEKSVKALTYDLNFDSRIKGEGIVVHIGSHQGRGWDAVKDQVAHNISKILKNTPEDSTFLIENSAGQKGKIASDLSEIKWLLDQVDSKRLGWCFDTCHGFTAGYWLAEKGQEEPVKPENERTKTAIQTITDLNLWRALKCVHVNDSKGEFGSGKDRHDNIGEGNLIKSDLRKFVNHPKLKKMPLILEVPGLLGKGPDAKNIEWLNDLID